MKSETRDSGKENFGLCKTFLYSFNILASRLSVNLPLIIKFTISAGMLFIFIIPETITLVSGLVP